MNATIATTHTATRPSALMGKRMLPHLPLCSDTFLHSQIDGTPNLAQPYSKEAAV